MLRTEYGASHMLAVSFLLPHTPSSCVNHTASPCALRGRALPRKGSMCNSMLKTKEHFCVSVYISPVPTTATATVGKLYLTRRLPTNQPHTTAYQSSSLPGICCF